MGMIQRIVLAVAIALLLLAPSAARAQTTADLIAADIDAWWSAEFAARGIPYSSPNFKVVSEPGVEFCGFFDVYYAPAGYCSSSRTITLSTGFVSPDAVNIVLTLVSHEWGHHIQNLTDTGITSAFESEQQADCFAGAFIAYATDADWISPVIGAMALQLTQSAGDVWWAVPYEESIHGTQSERAIAFLAGQQGGLEACGF
jgi:predicted metalloprotease